MNIIITTWPLWNLGQFSQIPATHENTLWPIQSWVLSSVGWASNSTCKATPSSRTCLQGKHCMPLRDYWSYLRCNSGLIKDQMEKHESLYLHKNYCIKYNVMEQLATDLYTARARGWTSRPLLHKGSTERMSQHARNILLWDSAEHSLHPDGSRYCHHLFALFGAHFRWGWILDGILGA